MALPEAFAEAIRVTSLLVMVVPFAAGAAQQSRDSSRPPLWLGAQADLVGLQSGPSGSPALFGGNAVLARRLGISPWEAALVLSAAGIALANTRVDDRLTGFVPGVGTDATTTVLGGGGGLPVPDAPGDELRGVQYQVRTTVTHGRHAVPVRFGVPAVRTDRSPAAVITLWVGTAP
jgi:hypothetical protein